MLHRLRNQRRVVSAVALVAPSLAAAFPLRAGVYLAVLFKDHKLMGMYVGRSRSLGNRFVEHWVTLSFDKYLPRSHTAAQMADKVLFFPLFEDASPNRFDEKSCKRRAILEVIWRLLLGTFTKSKAYLAVRRRYGMPNLGDQVLGLNSEPQRLSPSSVIVQC